MDWYSQVVLYIPVGYSALIGYQGPGAVLVWVTYAAALVAMIEWTAEQAAVVGANIQKTLNMRGANLDIPHRPMDPGTYQELFEGVDDY